MLSIEIFTSTQSVKRGRVIHVLQPIDKFYKHAYVIKCTCLHFRTNMVRSFDILIFVVQTDIRYWFWIFRVLDI